MTNNWNIGLWVDQSLISEWNLEKTGRRSRANRRLADLKRYFEQAGVPWIYEKPEPEIRISSAYNRKPKGQKHELNYETRLADLATIRKNFSQQEQLLEKLRQDRYDESTPRGLDKTVQFCWRWRGSSSRCRAKSDRPLRKGQTKPAVERE